MLLCPEMGMRLCNRLGMAGGGVNARWDGLVAGWKLDEESDGSGGVVRADVLETYALTDNNTVPSAAGIIGNAASFTAANSEGLSAASPAGLLTTTMTWVAWVKTSASGSYQCLFSKDSGGAPNREYGIYLDPTGKLYSEVYYSGGARVFADTTVVADGSWHFVAFIIDTDLKARWYIDDAAPVVSTAGSGTVVNGAEPFRVGSHANPYYWNGLIDEAYLFNEAKDATWVLDMYNSGAGRSYPD